MTTIYDFVPSSQNPFQFQPTLDGTAYNAIVTWSLAGRRYILNIIGLDGTIIVSTPVVGSPVGVNIASAVWAHGTVTMKTVGSHGYTLGATVDLVITGMTPADYNGTVQAFITARDEFTFPLTKNPGPATVFGMATYNINLVGGYFETSTLVYRTTNNQFEVSP